MHINHLQPDDFNTGVWKRFRKDLEVTLGELRELNDLPQAKDTDTDYMQTVALRARIALLKELLELGT